MISRRTQFGSLLAVVLVLLTVQGANAEVPKCGRPKQGVLIMQDFIRHPLGKPVDPVLPPGIDGRVLPLTISLRITVNREGTVIRVCAMDQERLPTQTVLLLNTAAESSVFKWKYPRDFGLAGDLHLSHRYGQGVVSFRFLPNPRETLNKLRSGGRVAQALISLAPARKGWRVAEP